MIEIIKEQDNWVAYVGGGLYHYNHDLGNLLEYLARRSEDIEEDSDN
jgi:hypothetical protein